MYGLGEVAWSQLIHTSVHEDEAEHYSTPFKGHPMQSTSHFPAGCPGWLG